jgi:RNA polymerase sigma-70 factor (ECF subfamily)
MAELPPRPPIAALVTEHHAVLYRFAYRLTGLEADAEDLTQQTFLVAIAKLEQVRPETARGWLFSILRSLYLKQRRRRTPMAASDLEFNCDTIPDDSIPDQSIDGERLQAALDELPDEFKVVVVMFYFQGASYKEIAAELDLPLGTVMSRLSRAKGHLRRRLFEAGPNCEPLVGAAVQRPRRAAEMGDRNEPEPNGAPRVHPVQGAVPQGGESPRHGTTHV